MTTVFHLHFDPRTGDGEYVRAGHPPALVRLPDGEVEELEGGGTPAAGHPRRTGCRGHQAELPRGSLLLLYTDGLIERRDAVLDEGLDRLKQALGDGPDRPPGVPRRARRGLRRRGHPRRRGDARRVDR